MNSMRCKLAKSCSSSHHLPESSMKRGRKGHLLSLLSLPESCHGALQVKPVVGVHVNAAIQFSLQIVTQLGSLFT